MNRRSIFHVVVVCALVLAAAAFPQRLFAQGATTTPSWPSELDFLKSAAGGIQNSGNQYLYLSPLDSLSTIKVTVGGQIAVSPAGAVCVPEKVQSSFEVDEADFISKANSTLDSNMGAGKVKVLSVDSVHYVLTFWDKSRVILPGKTPKQNIVFPFPTDPEVACVAVPIMFFTYEVNDLINQLGNAPKAKYWSYFVVRPSVSIIIIDQTQPEEVFFDPPAVMGTTGDKISEFNQKADAWGFKSDRNPTDIMVLVRDNNYFSNSKTPGFNHGKHPPNIAIYVETFVTHYAKVAADTPNMPKIEKVLGERVDESKFSGLVKATPDGAFQWIGPIWLDTDLPNWKFDIVAAENKNGQIDSNITMSNGYIANKENLCSVIVFKGPITDIEKAMETKFGVSSRLSNHFASRAGLGFTDQLFYDAHFMKDGSDPKLGDHYLRLCVAAGDASCNFKLPFFAGSSADARAPFAGKYGADLGVVRAETGTGGRVEALSIIPYDDSPPNPVLSVTNTETNTTTVFTIPNSDLCDANWTKTYPCPYAPYNIPADTYYFRYDNKSSTMKWLETNDKERYDEYVKALTINEDVRLIFDMMAYDNINKHVEVSVAGSMKVGNYGIVTPMYGMEKNDDNLLRFVTWKINDPTGPDNLKYEDQAQGIFVYPDYIFRNPDTSIYGGGSTDINKSYFVSFFVEDNSPFYNAASAVQGQKTNRRTLLVEFKISGKRTSSQSMGTSTLTMPGGGSAGLSGQAQPK